MQPIKRFNLDAAIIFSDILIVPYGLGQKVEFKKNFGPLLNDIDLSIFKKVEEENFTKKLNSDNTVLISGFWGNIAQITLGLDDLLPENFISSKDLKKSGKAGIFAGSLELVKEGNLKIKQDKLFDSLYIKET